MLGRALGRGAGAGRALAGALGWRASLAASLATVGRRCAGSSTADNQAANAAPDGSRDGGGELDPALLAVLGDPLDKKPLRYDREACELVNDRLGVAYPIVDGLPQLDPAKGRLLGPQGGDDGGDIPPP
eukprot:jgi/Tetstr1/447152/TSEL_034589.t1